MRRSTPFTGYIERALADAHGDPRLTAHQAAIATADGPIRMQMTHDPGSESVSPAGLYDSHELRRVPGPDAAFADGRVR